MKFIELNILDIFKIHLPALLFGFIALLSVLFVKWISIYLTLNAIVSILFSGILFIVLSTFLILVDDKRFLGKDMMWIKTLVTNIVKKKVKK